MEKKWNVVIDGRGKDSGQIINEILEARGIEDVEHFLHPDESDLVPFEKMKNLDKAAQVILDGVEQCKKFFVHYDNDCDGATAGSIAVRYLRHLGADVSYGINPGKVHGIKDADISMFEGADILWIVDSIQTEIEPYEKILEMGIETLLISDHHNIEKELCEEMEANGNIILVSSFVDYPNPHLSGSATTWKICNYIDWIELDDYSEALMELAATGLVADLCSVGLDSMENRYLCHKGFANTSNLGIKKINGSYEMNTQAVSFGIAPRINAANRVNRNELAMNLFITDDNKEALSIVKGLNACRDEQNDVVAELMPDLMAQAEEQQDKKYAVLFLPGEVDADVSGLLGNKILSELQKPVLILRRKIGVDTETGEITSDQYVGSARSVGVDNFKHLCDCTGVVSTGGHDSAFGIWFDVKDFKQFTEFLDDMMADVEFVQQTIVDVELSEEQLTVPFIKQLESLNRISGTNFPAINVCLRGVDKFMTSSMSGGKHLKITTENGLDLISWNYNGDWDQFVGDVEISVVGTVAVSFFGRKLSRQVIIQDMIVEERL